MKIRNDRIGVGKVNLLFPPFLLLEMTSIMSIHDLPGSVIQLTNPLI